MCPSCRVIKHADTERERSNISRRKIVQDGSWEIIKDDDNGGGFSKGARLPSGHLLLALVNGVMTPGTIIRNRHGGLFYRVVGAVDSTQRLEVIR